MIFSTPPWRRPELVPLGEAPLPVHTTILYSIAVQVENTCTGTSVNSMFAGIEMVRYCSTVP